MSNRIIKESILTSPNLNELSDLAERHFYRLLVISDDWGCFESTPAIIKGKCYPLKEKVTRQNVESWQKELEDKNLIKSWITNDRQYSQFVKFAEHNDLSTQHTPTTPCPPWMLNENKEDTRLATETLQAFEKIRVAVCSISSNGKKPTYREICGKTGCSMSTVAKYFKQAQLDLCYTDDTPHYTSATPVLRPAIDATHKNPNPNPNPNHNPNPTLLVTQNEFSEKAAKLTQQLISSMQKNDPRAKIPKNISLWITHMERIMRVDKRTPEEISKVISWCQSDKFWKTNILSTSKLREQFPKLYLKMTTESNNGRNGNGKIGELSEQNAIEKFEWSD